MVLACFYHSRYKLASKFQVVSFFVFNTRSVRLCKVTLRKRGIKAEDEGNKPGRTFTYNLKIIGLDTIMPPEDSKRGARRKPKRQLFMIDRDSLYGTIWREDSLFFLCNFFCGGKKGTPLFHSLNLLPEQYLMYICPQNKSNKKLKKVLL